MRRIKKSFAILRVVSLVIILNLIFVNPGFSQITQHIYGGSQHDYASKIIKTPDSGFLILGYTNSYGAGNRDVYLVKINSDYEQQWQQTYGGTSAEYAFDIIETYDNNYLILAKTHSYEIAGNSKPDIYLIKVDENGNQLDAKTIRTYSYEEYGYLLTKTNDNNYLITGRIQGWYQYGSYTNAHMIKINQELNPIWKRFYGLNTSAGRTYKQENGYLVTGSYYDKDNQKYSLYLFKTDLYGYLTWEETIERTDSIFPQDVKMTKNNKLVFPGSTLPYGGTHSLYLLKTDLEGQVELEETYPNQGYNETATDMLITKDNQYLIFGHVYKPETNYDFFLMKTDTNGNEIWKKTWGGDQGDYAGIVEQLEDGTYQMMAGTSSWGAGLADMYIGIFKNQHVIENLNSVVKEQEFDEEIRVKEYVFTLEEQTEVGIVSGGSLDLRANLYDENRNLVVENSGYTDVGSCTCLTGENQIENGHDQTNFMLRADLSPGTYLVEVYPETEETPIEGQFSVVFLKRPENSEEFFAGMNTLLSDNDLTNDYLDIYVKAVFHDLYASVDELETVGDVNYGGSVCDSSICRERQCKALSNFFSNTFYGNFLLFTQDIADNWLTFDDTDENCIADTDYIIQADEGELIHHADAIFGSSPECGSEKYFYDPDEDTVFRGEFDLSNFVEQGDVFVQGRGGHYGLIYDNTLLLDSNVVSPGRMEITSFDQRNPETWKISRPQ